jgi:hypothetical protein
MYWAGGRARALTGTLCGVRKCWERLGKAVIRGVTSLPVAHPRDLRMVSTHVGERERAFSINEGGSAIAP